MAYSFGIPGYVIWSFHLIMGSFLAYVGYQMTQNEDKPIRPLFSTIILVLGVLSVLYHGHIWLVDLNVM